MPKNTNPGLTRPVVRHYDVVIKPDEATEYDPIKVTLSYTLEQAEQLDPTGPAAKAEAFRRAIAIERRLNNTPPQRSFLNGGVKFTRQRLSTSA